MNLRDVGSETSVNDVRQIFIDIKSKGIYQPENLMSNSLYIWVRVAQYNELGSWIT
jgi:hypothetical protein